MVIARKKYIYGSRLNQLMAEKYISPEDISTELEIGIDIILKWLNAERSEISGKRFIALSQLFNVNERSMAAKQEHSYSDFRTIGEINAVAKESDDSATYGQIAAQKRLQMTKIKRQK